MDYLYTTEKDIVWKKFSRALFTNNMQNRNITFMEHAVNNTINGQYPVDIPGYLQEQITVDNEYESIDLVDPETGAIIGTSTYHELFVLLNSTYIKLAKQRDTK